MQCVNTTAHVDETGIDVVRIWDSNHARQTTAALVNCERDGHKCMQSCQWSFGYTTTRQQSLSMRCLSFRCVVVGDFAVCSQCMHNWLMPVNNIHGRMSPKRFFPLFGTLFASDCSFFWWRVFVNRCIRTTIADNTHTQTLCVSK